jgi:hypothetical protein
MAVSLWLNAGVAPAQVAEWAGHSTDVLLRVYAKCISGQQNEAKRRILEATEPRQTRRIRRQTRNPGHRGTPDREP